VYPSENENPFLRRSLGFAAASWLQSLFPDTPNPDTPRKFDLAPPLHTSGYRILDTAGNPVASPR